MSLREDEISTSNFSLEKGAINLSSDSGTQTPWGDNVPSETFEAKLSSKRLQLAILGFLGFGLVFSMRLNLTVALVDMVTPVDDDSTGVNDNCPVDDSLNATSQTEGTFNWTMTQQANILGGFYYGYMVTQIPAGILCSKYGGKIPFGFGIFATGVFTLLTPPVAYLGSHYLIALRVLMGMAEASTFPSFNHLMGQWVPKNERSVFSAFTYSGGLLGTIVTQPLVGYLCTLPMLDGWPIGFYGSGGLAVVWMFAWMFLVSNSPSEHPSISEREKRLIMSNTTTRDRKQSIPWKSIVTSGPFYGLLICHFCVNSITYGLQAFLPNYLFYVLNFNIAADGFVNAVGNLFLFVSVLLVSNISDFVRRHDWLSTTVVRKANQIVGTCVSGALLALAGYSGCDATRAVCCIVAAYFFTGANYSGYNCNNLDLAPNFAGVIFSITNTFATVPGIVAPLVVNWITSDDIHSAELWRTVFFLFAGVGSFGGLAFLILGSGELQPWAIGDLFEDEKEHLNGSLDTEETEREP